MKHLRPIFLIIGLALLAGCGAAPKITYDYDDTVDFNTFSTFILAQKTLLNLKPLDSTRFVNALARALKTKGITSTKKADLIISIKRDEKEAKSNTQIGVGMGQQTRHVGINIGGVIPIPRNASTQTITIDFREVTTHKLIWQSHIRNTYKNSLTPEEKEKMYYNLFLSVLKGYPPLTQSKK
ncbi:MAG: DUF4136 domain-containing protein [Flavobacteriaceae bacterium]